MDQPSGCFLSQNLKAVGECRVAEVAGNRVVPAAPEAKRSVPIRIFGSSLLQLTLVCEGKNIRNPRALSGQKMILFQKQNEILLKISLFTGCTVKHHQQAVTVRTVH